VFDSQLQFVNTMTLNFKLILDEFNRRFDEWEARWDQRFSPPPSMEPQPQDDPSVAFALIFNNTTMLGPANSGAVDDSVKALVASTDPNALLNTVTADTLETPSVDVGADVVADNWGGCFDDSEQYYGSPSVVTDNWGGCFDGEQYRTRPSVVDDNWGGFFGGEDLTSSGNPTRFVLPIASTDEPSIDITLARANSEATDDSVFVTTEPAGYDESELHATVVLDVLPRVHTLDKCMTSQDKLVIDLDPDDMETPLSESALPVVPSANEMETPTTCSTLVLTEHAPVEAAHSCTLRVPHGEPLPRLLHAEQLEQALEQNEISSKGIKSLGAAGPDLLQAEIDAANIKIVLGKFDDAVPHRPPWPPPTQYGQFEKIVRVMIRQGHVMESCFTVLSIVADCQKLDILVDGAGYSHLGIPMEEADCSRMIKSVGEGSSMFPSMEHSEAF
jgi:hypothetical protein